MNRFIAIDVETANSDYSSICQVGLVVFEDGNIVDTWKSYIDPEVEFSRTNTRIHGITEDMVQGAPKFPEILDFLKTRFSNEIFVHHTHFDRSAFDLAAKKHKLKPIAVRWVDSTRLVRRVWPQFQDSGYGLSNLTSHFNIDFDHHDALEDARAAGIIAWRAICESGRSVDEWVTLAIEPLPAPLRGGQKETSIVISLDEPPISEQNRPDVKKINAEYLVLSKRLFGQKKSAKFALITLGVGVALLVLFQEAWQAGVFFIGVGLFWTVYISINLSRTQKKITEIGYQPLEGSFRGKD